MLRSCGNTSMKKNRVAVVGAGPAGIFAVKTLAENGVKDVVLFDEGKDISERTRSDILRGWGGAGAFSDGKLILSPEVGGNLTDLMPVEKVERLIEEVDKAFVQFGAPQERIGPDPITVEKIKRKTIPAGMNYIPMEMKHLGTERCREILEKMRNSAEDWCEFYPETKVEELITDGEKIKGLRVAGKIIEAEFVIVAPGRAGSEWLQRECEKLGIKSIPSHVDIGVRVEVPYQVMEEITEAVYELKLIYYTPTFDDRVRTFCMNPNGEVVIEKADNLMTVNGHSFKNKKTGLTNFALLVSTHFTYPFKDPIAYGKSIASLANLLGNSVIVQRYGDFLMGRRSTEERIRKNLFQPSLKEATPGDLSFVLPYRILKDIQETIEAMDKIIPGIASPSTLLYGVEVKFYSNRYELNENLETRIKNLYLAGDGAGITRGLVQSAVSGMVCALDIIRKIKGN